MANPSKRTRERAADLCQLWASNDDLELVPGTALGFTSAEHNLAVDAWVQVWWSDEYGLLAMRGKTSNPYAEAEALLRTGAEIDDSNL